jgi:hypothetical protein
LDAASKFLNKPGRSNGGLVVEDFLDLWVVWEGFGSVLNLFVISHFELACSRTLISHIVF